MSYELMAGITMTSHSGGAVPVAEALAEKMAEISGIKSWDLAGDLTQAWIGLTVYTGWAGHAEDIAAFSAVFPDLRITADIEDMNGDRWRIYALAGAVQNEPGELVFGASRLWGDPPDVWATHPILAAPLAETDLEAIRAEGPPLGVLFMGIDHGAPGGDATVIGITVSPREHATILAALRWWQRTPDDWLPNGIIEIAEEHGPRLTPAEIDALCERINSDAFFRGSQWSEKQIAEIEAAGPHAAAQINRIGGAA